MTYNVNELYDLTNYTPETQKELSSLLNTVEKIGNVLSKDELSLLINLIVGGCGYEVACALDIKLHPKRYEYAIVENF